MKEKNNYYGKKILSKTVSVFFVSVSLVFICSSFSILFYGVWNFFSCYYNGCDFFNNILNISSYLIVAVAIFDVGRNLIEEEVFRHYQMRSPKEARGSLTKFLVIILVAITLESLIVLIKSGTSNVSELIYPAIMFISASLLLASLGLYQRFSVGAELGMEKEQNKEEEF